MSIEQRDCCGCCNRYSYCFKIFRTKIFSEKPPLTFDKRYGYEYTIDKSFFRGARFKGLSRAPRFVVWNTLESTLKSNVRMKS